MKKLIFLIALLFFNNIGFSQPVCGGTFTDNGGISSNYLNNTNEITTICPNIIGEAVTVTFTSFSTEATFDGLYVYDGLSANINLIASANPAGNGLLSQPGAFWGNDNPGTFTSTTSDGCLTFRFISDNSTNDFGFTTNVTCGPQTTTGPQIGFILNAFLDSNINGVKDNFENYFSLGQFEVQKNGVIINTIYAGNGVRYVYDNDPLNIYNFNYLIDSSISSNFNLPVNFSGLNPNISSGMVTLNFPIVPNNLYKDLEVNLTPFGNPRAGFNYNNRISFTNNGNQTINNGSINFTKNPLTTINNTSEIVNQIATGFTYNFINLLPFESRFIDVSLLIPSIPTVNIGDLITNSASVNTTETELTLINNNSIIINPIVAAYDPNDITEIHGEKILFSSFDPNEFLTYTIRFENTGTASAENIRITDNLDTKIDEATIKMLGSSHNCVLNRINKVLTWKFDNINLPVSVANSIIGKGFVTFKAKLKPGFTVGTIIPNQAKIYFDTNPAIDTNVFNTEFVNSLAINNFEISNFAIAPNPVKNYLKLENKNNISIKEINIYNAIGQLIMNKNPDKIINVSNLNSGNYFIKITTENKVFNLKFIKE
jgi:Secretion system C-terminal sorting domain